MTFEFSQHLNDDWFHNLHNLFLHKKARAIFVCCRISRIAEGSKRREENRDEKWIKELRSNKQRRQPQKKREKWLSKKKGMNIRSPL